MATEESSSKQTLSCRIKSVLYVSGDFQAALVRVESTRLPVNTHMRIALLSLAEDDLASLTPKQRKMYDAYKQKPISNSKEPALCQYLSIPCYPHRKKRKKVTFYIFASFPVLSDSLEYELTVEQRHSTPAFLVSHLQGNPVFTITRFLGIYKTDKPPKLMIYHAANMVSERQIRKDVKEKFLNQRYAPDYTALTPRDAVKFAKMRVFKANARCKLFLERLLLQHCDKTTARLAPWIPHATLMMYSVPERDRIVRALEHDIANVFDFDSFEIMHPPLFNACFGHQPDTDFAEAYAFRKSLKNHLYGTFSGASNKYISTITVDSHPFVGEGTVGMGCQRAKDTMYAIRRDVLRYREVMQRLKTAKIIVSDSADSNGAVCVVAHPDDIEVWQSTSDVDRVFLLTDITARQQSPLNIVIYRAHTWSFEHWVLLCEAINPECKITIVGRLDQHPHGRGQIFRDLTEILEFEEKQCSVTNNVECINHIPTDVSQVFYGGFNTNVTIEPPPKTKNKIWLGRPRRIRTVFRRNDKGYTIFAEDEPAANITDLSVYKPAWKCHIRQYRGAIVDHALFVVDGATPFEIFTARTHAHKVSYIYNDLLHKPTIPAETGRVPRHRSLTSIIKT